METIKNNNVFKIVFSLLLPLALLTTSTKSRAVSIQSLVNNIKREIEKFHHSEQARLNYEANIQRNEILKEIENLSRKLQKNEDFRLQSAKNDSKNRLCYQEKQINNKVSYNQKLLKEKSEMYQKETNNKTNSLEIRKNKALNTLEILAGEKPTLKNLEKDLESVVNKFSPIKQYT